MLHKNKKIFSLIVSLLAVFSVILSACTTATSGPSTTAAPAGTSAHAASSEAAAEPFGKPWIVTSIQGYLPDKAPEFKDDIYTHYNYDYLAERKDRSENNMFSHLGDVEAAITKVINDKSHKGHAFEQLQIFYDQAKDMEAVKKTGFSEVQPYIDMIDSVDSIEKMNELLSSDKFPFTPFVNVTLGITDTRGDMAVAVYPNFVLSDITEGGTYYRETDDENLKQGLNQILATRASDVMIDAYLLGLDNETLVKAVSDVTEFDRRYGKYAEIIQKYVSAEYGVLAQAAKEGVMTLEQVCALCPQMPMKAMLAKCKKDSASKYVVTSSKWLSALNDMWKPDNLDTIKLVAKVKILDETRPFRDLSGLAEMVSPGTKLNPDRVAYYACNNLNTFSHLLAKIYVEDCLGSRAKERINRMTADIVDTYKELVDKTIWLDDMSAALIKEKLDHITLNVLEPVSGYCDFAGLELTPTDKGGSLLSNYLKLKEYRFEWESGKIGKTATGDVVWNMITPLTANTYYETTSNSINICPGEISSLLYSDKMSDTELLARLGFYIGHEISHAFDYLGSQIDAYGLPKPVFSDKALEAFLAKAKSITDYFSTIEYQPGVFVDGKIIIDEAIADLSGFQAILEVMKKRGSTDYESFFSSLANVWAQSMSAGEITLYATDTHPFNYLRVNVNAQMFDVIYDKFGVKEGDGMYLAPEKRIVIWNDK